MKNSNYKKVLLFGQEFNNFTGGGITLSNLFKDWPLDRIALVTTSERLANLDTSKCNNVYLMGNHEIKRLFPTNLLKKDFDSGPINTKTAHATHTFIGSKSAIYLLKKTLLGIINRSLIFLGFKHFLFKYNVSHSVVSFLKSFSPDFIYTQAGSLAEINFINELHHRFSIPIVLHIMDDHMKSDFNAGLFNKLFTNPIHSAFQQLVNNAYIKIGICEAMAIEYSRRYGGKWEFFHNSVDISKWTNKGILAEKPQEPFKIFYLGKAIFNNAPSLLQFAKIIHNLAIKGVQVELHLYIVSVKKSIKKKLEKFKNVYCFSPVSHSEVPRLISGFDLLLLPLAFTKAGYRYAKYSMPTKMSEYMISGIPTLVFAPSDCALTKYAKKKNVAFICSENNEKSVVSCLKEIISDHEKRKKIAENAIKVAKKSHDIQKESIRFRSLLNN
jgi:glycosyltransferase involved in cell wall biosynthesis